MSRMKYVRCGEISAGKRKWEQECCQAPRLCERRNCPEGQERVRETVGSNPQERHDLVSSYWLTGGTN